jgi:hypothetical protein
MTSDVVNRFTAVRLRRHGQRPLCFDGALLVRAGEADGPQLSLYETADGALAVAIQLPGFYNDAWRLDSIDEVAEFVEGFDAEAQIGFGVDLGDDGGAHEFAAGDPAALAMGPAYRRVVDSFIRVSHSSTS